MEKLNFDYLNSDIFDPINFMLVEIPILVGIAQCTHTQSATGCITLQNGFHFFEGKL